MAVKADRTYSGTIIGGGIHYASTGSLGISIQIECPDGTIQHTWWVSEKTKDRVKKNLLEIGVPEQSLTSVTALEGIGDVMNGTEVEFTTISEEWKGKERVRVQWVNPPKKNTGVDPAKQLAALFGNGQVTTASKLPAAADKISDHLEITDEDVPF